MLNKLFSHIRKQSLFQSSIHKKNTAIEIMENNFEHINKVSLNV